MSSPTPGFKASGRILDRIRQAVREDRCLVSLHADERRDERGVSDWQLVDLADGTEVEVIWSWLAESRRTRRATVYFRDA